MTDLATHLDKQMLKRVVQTLITDHRGRVLDVRTAIIVRDRDGDPFHAYTPETWAELKATKSGLLRQAIDDGLTFTRADGSEATLDV